MTHNNFELVDERMLPDLSCVGKLLRHCPSGAEVLALQNSDPEMLFGILVETALNHSDGVAHLLEHLVFRGSQRYPHNQLYAGLVQGTLLTGLNASTRSDSTLFHVSSSHAKDFSNQIDVLMDAVFNPLLLAPDFYEERDVVMNEMHGHLAVPLNQITATSRQSLLPESVYSFDSGGLPEAIRELSLDRLREFHAANYRSDTSRLFLWGNIDLDARLDQIDRLLPSAPSFAAPPTGSLVRFEQPKHVEATFPARATGLPTTAIGWAFDVEDVDLWQVLSLELMDARSGNLQSALARVGGRVLGRGFSKETPLGTFDLILANHVEVAQTLVIETLAKGLDVFQKGAADSAFLLDAVDRFECRLRGLGMLNQGPAGLRALNMILGQWRHNADPLELLDIGMRLAKLRVRFSEDPEAMSECITRDLLGNAHQLVLTMKPEENVVSLTAPTTAIKVAPDPHKVNSAPDLPFISLDQVPHFVKQITVEEDGKIHNLPVSNPKLARAELVFSLSGLSLKEQDLVSILLLLQKDRRETVGVEVSARLWAGTGRGVADGVWLSIEGQSLPSHAVNLLESITGFLEQPVAAEHQMSEQIRSERDAIKSQIAAYGHLQCETRLRALGSFEGSVYEKLIGISRFQTLELALRQESDDLMAQLEKLRLCLSRIGAAKLAVSGIDPELAKKALAGQGAALERNSDRPNHTFAQQEAIETSAANFTTGQSMPLEDDGAAHVAAHMLETGWLWDSVRVSGGAYSVRARYDSNDGLLSILSIRDPNPERTLSQFAKAPIWLSQNGQGALLARCVAAKIGHLTRPERPDQCLSVALRRHLCGVTDAMRQMELDQLRSVDAKRMRLISENMNAGISSARTVVLGPHEGLDTLVLKRPEIALRDSLGRS